MTQWDFWGQGGVELQRPLLYNIRRFSKTEKPLLNIYKITTSNIFGVYDSKPGKCYPLVDDWEKCL